MKHLKDRLHRVMVLGATPAGIAATNKLGELGIPVTLVDTEADLDRKLNREEWRLKSGLALNHAHRPGLIRILRNPGIKYILPAEVTSVKHSPQGFRVVIRQVPSFIDAEKCTLCGRCAETCPVTTADGEKAVKYNGRQSLPGRPIIDKRRRPLCQESCPLGVNAQGYIALTRAGRYAEALELIRRENVLPSICGRICTHPCEAACRRGDVDAPVAIRDIKRFVADHETDKPVAAGSVPKRPEKIAVIGSGPAGLAAAADLARTGYAVTIFEKENAPGGLLRYGIGPHRLPREVLDRELDYIRDLGVTFQTGYPVDLAGGLDALKKEFSSVIITTGTWKDRKLGIPGEEAEGVHGCLSFLCEFFRNENKKRLNNPPPSRPSPARGEGENPSAPEVHWKLEENVAIIGDGNAAFDLARTLARIGANVTILSWFPKEMIPADPEEVKGATEEGITITDRTQVVEFKNQNGRFEAVGCLPTEPGEPDANGIPWPVPVKGGKPFDLKFDRVFVAIGQQGEFSECACNPKSLTNSPFERKSVTTSSLEGKPLSDSPLEGGKGGVALEVGIPFAVTAKGTIQTDDSLRTSIPGVYAAGDAVNGPRSVVEAMASGKKAARSVHQDVCGNKANGKNGCNHVPVRTERDFCDIPANLPHCARTGMSECAPKMRIKGFPEVALGYSEAQAVSEAGRCLQCGVCSECLQCETACDAVGAVNHSAMSGEMIEQTGVLIIADPAMAPSIKGEDVIRAYSRKSEDNDVSSMFVRGFDAAAQAILLLKSKTGRSKGHGLSFLTPDQGLSPVIRLGVFACRCNDSMGWLGGMDDYIENLSARPDVVHAETLPAACVPEGATRILRAIRNKGITRVVLASCVCCPLNYVCNSCTDQKSRLKDALFAATGVSRSMVETSNLRGEVLRMVKADPEMALRMFTGLMDRSIARARRLKALPALARNYNFATAVIGESESARTSAETLADTGLDVFLFGTFPEPPEHPNIHNFRDAHVNSISGTIGEFEIDFDSGGFQQTFQVGVVILGEKSRKTIQYIHQKGLPAITVTAGGQKAGVTGIPFFYPGATAIPGLYLAEPPGITVSRRKKGAAAAIQAASVMPRGPRQSKGYTVVIDKDICRGCGRCMRVCPYQAVSFKANGIDGWFASVDEALCKGCGNCISVCPSNAADSPYRNQAVLEQTLGELLAGVKVNGGCGVN